jgi:photosystem II stability/assembly factor-like uncharacterized protein
MSPSVFGSRRVRNFPVLIILGASLGVVAWSHIRRSAAARLPQRAVSQISDQDRIARRYGELPLSFERNDGQTGSDIKFISRGPGYDLFLSTSGAVLNLRTNRPSDARDSAAPQATSVASQLRWQMIGANPDVAVSGDEELPGKVNYLVGNDPNAWHANIPTYRRVRYTRIFPGVDLVFYGNRTQLEYDFILAAGAKVNSVKFRIDGADRITVGTDGELRISTRQGEIQMRKPQIYQSNERGDYQSIAGDYVVRESEVGFRVGAFDRKRPLVIDPVLAYSTLLGGVNDDFASSIAVDSQGFAYVTGSAGTGFPTTAGSLQSSGNTLGTAFVTKIDQTGTNLIYSTYLGGNSPGSAASTTGNGIAVDASGNAVITGTTTAGDFPTQNPIRGGRNNLLITSDGGGSWAPNNIGTANRPIQALGIDKNTPTTMYACANGGIFKTLDGGLNWATLNTGIQNPPCTAMVIDPTASNIVYAAFNVNANPAASGVYKSIDGGASWSFASSGVGTIPVTALAIDPQTPATLYVSTANGFFKTTNGGASWTSSATGMAAFGQNAIVIDPTTTTTVYTGSSGGGVYKSVNGGANWAQFNSGLTNLSVRSLLIDPVTAATLYAGTANGVFKTTNNGSTWNTASGGLPTNLTVTALAIDPASNSTLFLGTTDGRMFKTTNAGGNWSQVYATTSNTTLKALLIQPGNSAKVFAGVDSTNSTITDQEVFVTKLNAAGSGLVFSTFLGGLGNDLGLGIALDGNGNVYVSGQTRSTDFPVLNAAQTSGSGCDGFITKINANGSALVFSTYLGGSGCDVVRRIAVDSFGNVYVAGDTMSPNFATPGAFQTTLGDSGGDAFVSKLNASGGIVYVSYLGGNNTDNAYGVAADSQGNAYVTGITTSSNFPTANALQGTKSFDQDAFVTKVNANGTALIYSTYLGGGRPGGSLGDFGAAIAVDADGNAYVAGSTDSVGFPLTPGSIKTQSPFFKSYDGGNHWNNESFGFDVSPVNLLAVDPTATAKLYSATQLTNLRSVDGGRTWIPSMTGLTSPLVRAIVVNPVSSSTVYLAGSSGGSNGVFKSTNGGQSWSPASNGLNNAGVLSLVIDPLTPANLYAVTGSALFKSVDSGGSWNKIGPSTFTAARLFIDPLTPTILYATSDSANSGVLKSIDSGANWQAVSSGLTNLSIPDLAIDPTTPSTLYAGAANGPLFKSTNGGGSWTTVSTTLQGPVAIDPSNSANVYATGTNNGGLFKSTNGGSTWNPINNGLRNSFITAILVNPTNSAIVYACDSISTDTDAFVLKLNPSGSSLLFSTLLGGSTFNSPAASDTANGIALDPAGNVYITGSTRSNDFPSDQNSYQPFNRGSSDTFVAKLGASYIINGQVLDGASAPVAGAEVVLNDGTSLTSVLTESDGSYQFSRLRQGGNFTVSVNKIHFTMTPASQTFNNLSSNQTQNFVAASTSVQYFTVNGQITSNGTNLNGANVTLSGAQQDFTVTDSNGNYSFTVAAGGNYTVTPSILGFTFGPPSQSFSNLSGNQTANFAGTRQSFVVTNVNDHGTGSLRQAILDANGTQGTDTITFNIPGAGVQTINLLIPLPTITDPVVIDATTQPGYSGSPLIELNGSQTSSNGLQITAGNSTVKGLIINRFSGSGVAAILLTTNGGNTIQGNFIGVDATGAAAQINMNGILITSGSGNNLIGGSSASARNVISANTFADISLNTAGNQVQGNFIGTNAAGTAAIPPASHGIDITGSNATNNLVGGTATGAGNLISGNSTGINISGTGATVQGNLIGTDVTGLKSVSNALGINDSAANALIGGLVPGARNVVSGNTGDGVAMNGNGSILQGNLVGTDITGSAVLANGGNGVSAGNNALIGGTVDAARNIISGNCVSGGFANLVLGINNSGAVTVQGNYIGTDVTGSIALKNPKWGIAVESSANTIGGQTPGARNIISGNTAGIQFGAVTSFAASSNLVVGNYIGLNQAGTGALPNTGDGIKLDASPPNVVANNFIGGPGAGAGNTIAFNGGSGVFISSGTADSIRGNSIFSNGGLGIDLGAPGITANDQGDVDTGPNNLQNFPVLTSLTPANSPTTITGALNSTANTTFTIDFYSNTSCDPSGNGEGAQFIGHTAVTTAADGNATISFTLGSALPAGTIITATATDPANNTSEFSPCASGTIISFSQPSYSVNEGDGSLNITVNRSGDTTLPVTVDYATSDGGASLVPCATANGKASAKCDFTDAVGTLRFAAGETSKTFPLLITQDTYVEGPETLTIGLANATNGAALASPSTATVTINDDMTEPPGNAIDDAGNFVRQHYHDFLNREPDQSGLAFWTGQMTNCGATDLTVCRVNVSGAFFLSIEFQQTGYLVERMYKVAYGNGTGVSNLGGTAHQLIVPIVRFNEFLKDTQRIGEGVVVLQPGWEQALENNKQAYAGEFVATARFITAFPTTMTPAQFVDKLNTNAGNVLSQSERTTAINLFGNSADTTNTTARAQALRQVAEDPDLFSAESNRAFVLAQYFGYLRRNPNDLPDSDYTGYDFWLQKLNQFNGDYVAAEMVKAFISAGEYRQRFGP